MPDRRRRRRLAIKRLLDIVVSASALVILWPLLASVAIAIRLSMGSPVLFRQARPGLDGQPFDLIKFRTMTEARGDDGELLSEDQRATRLGVLIRRWSVDELPELWNVVKGEMSLVGPRPLLTEYLPRYSLEQLRRHHMKPGITGLAQVKGRHKVEWNRRFRLDTWYVDHWSLRLDMAILCATVRVITKGQGEVHPEEKDHYFMGEAQRPCTTTTTTTTTAAASASMESCPAPDTDAPDHAVAQPEPVGKAG